MMRLLRALLMVFILAGVFAAPAMAQTAGEPSSEIKIDKKKLLVQPRNADGSPIMVSFWEDPVLWVREKQQAYYGSMSGTLRQIRTESPYAAAWTLMLLSFGYGIFHAAGPGHGKTVISAWLLATENELKRGIVIAFLSSIIQAFVAILLVSVLFLVVASASSAARDPIDCIISIPVFRIPTHLSNDMDIHKLEGGHGLQAVHRRLQAG